MLDKKDVWVYNCGYEDLSAGARFGSKHRLCNDRKKGRKKR